MAAQCQKCSAPLEGDFGVIHCAQCGEVNFLDEGPEPVALPESPVAETPSWESPDQEVTRRPEPTITKTQQEQMPEDVLKEIVDFGNQPAAATESGVLLYDLQISGIDTLELRKALVEVLKDSKFRWNAEELEANIKGGILLLRKLPPIKASILIKKIRHLDLDVHWSQGSIYESPAL